MTCIDCGKREGTRPVVQFVDGTVGCVCKACYGFQWRLWLVQPGQVWK